jgi:hypothetical protein
VLHEQRLNVYINHHNRGIPQPPILSVDDTTFSRATWIFLRTTHCDSFEASRLLSFRCRTNLGQFPLVAKQGRSYGGKAFSDPLPTPHTLAKALQLCMTHHVTVHTCTLLTNNKLLFRENFISMYTI